MRTSAGVLEAALRSARWRAATFDQLDGLVASSTVDHDSEWWLAATVEELRDAGQYDKAEAVIRIAARAGCAPGALARCAPEPDTALDIAAYLSPSATSTGSAAAPQNRRRRWPELSDAERCARVQDTWTARSGAVPDHELDWFVANVDPFALAALPRRVTLVYAALRARCVPAVLVLVATYRQRGTLGLHPDWWQQDAYAQVSNLLAVRRDVGDVPVDVPIRCAFSRLVAVQLGHQRARTFTDASAMTAAQLAHSLCDGAVLESLSDVLGEKPVGWVREVLKLVSSRFQLVGDMHLPLADALVAALPEPTRRELLTATDTATDLRCSLHPSTIAELPTLLELRADGEQMATALECSENADALWDHVSRLLGADTDELWAILPRWSGTLRCLVDTIVAVRAES